jgi:phage terminase large subunit-like protein
MRFTSRKKANEFYREVLRDAERDGCVQSTMAELGKKDLFFLLSRILNRQDIQNDWLFDRCQEVQQEPNECLDLWAREHRKSTIITFALTIQDIICDPEITIGIFSITRPLAKDFLKQIKTEFEDNRLLKELYSDVLWKDPKKQAKIWSLDDGIIVRRKTNPKESTVEAFGLLEGLPTGKHFHIRVYDDMIDEKTVTSPEIIKKSIERWELSLNIGSDRHIPKYNTCNIARYIGTRYHFNDPYAEMKKRNVAKIRLHPATDNGKIDGNPVYFTQALLNKKREDMGPYIFGCQLLLDPTADEAQGFKEEWFEHWYPKEWDRMNIYILIDPASEKKKTSDYTVMWVVGLAEDGNTYLIDGVRDRFNLTQRTNWLFKLHRQYRPIAVGYEKYGMQADIEHIEYVMEDENYRFQITPLGGQMPKNDRIKRLIPTAENHKLYIPAKLIYVDTHKKTQNLSHYLLQDEFLAFPVSQYDDAMDCLARIKDEEMNAQHPEIVPAGLFKKPETAATDYDIFA